MFGEDSIDKTAEMPTVPFFGLDFHPLTVSQTVNAIVDEAARNTSFKYVVTPNVDHMVRLDREPDLKAAYSPAWLTVCDSRILEIFANMAGLGLPPCPGADVVEALFDHHIQPDDPVVIVGGDEHTITAMQNRYGVRNIAWHSPPMGLRNNPDALRDAAEFVANANGKWVFLSVGSPQQEMLAHAIDETGRATGICICCGASLEFLAGKVKRAPVWMRQIGFEWLHRLLHEPRRLWKRYLIDGAHILTVWRKYARS